MKTSIWKRGIGIGVAAVLLSVTPALWAFDTFEHRHLGNVAYEQAMIAVGSTLSHQAKNDLALFESELNVDTKQCTASNQIKPSQCMALKALKSLPVRFGDFAALAGDHAGTPAEVYAMVQNFVRVGESKNEKEVDRILATRRQWQRACAQMRAYYQNLSKADDLHCVKDDGAWLESADAVLPPRGYSPQRDEWSEFEGLAGFLNLVSSNQSHFPTHSWREYTVHHYAALQAAKSYKDKSVDKEGCRDFITMILFKNPEYYGEDAPLCYLRRALVYEGYAQHFLHDSFSSGHIGTEFGTCPLLNVLACAPDKHLVNHVHNELNRLGLQVVFDPTAQQILMEAKERLGLSVPKWEAISRGWLAAGDDFLMVPEAKFHRQIVGLIATLSLIDVLETMGGKGGNERTFQEVCLQSVNMFPMAADAELMRNIDRSAMCKRPDGEKFSEDTKDLARFQADLPYLWSGAGYIHRLFGRSMDDRVRIFPLEGWKFMVTWGQAWGRFDELNADGTRQSVQNRSTNGTFEVGYVRKTESWIPNYLGFGAALTSGVRAAIYPLSVGYWGATDSRTIFWGLRMNAGLRIEESLVESNPGQRRLSSMELAFPLDIGFKVYKGVSLYIRPELLAINFPGFAGSDPANRAVVEHIFNGQGRLTFGLVLDFGEVL